MALFDCYLMGTEVKGLGEILRVCFIKHLLKVLKIEGLLIFFEVGLKWNSRYSWNISWELHNFICSSVVSFKTTWKVGDWLW